MEQYINRVYEEERALYGSKDIELLNCQFDGPADGESAIKECENVVARNCYFNLRYPFWHVKGLGIYDSEMTEHCRAALWYSKDIEIKNTKLHGIKALRECENINILNSDIISPEFGWSSKNITMDDVTAMSEYFMMRAEDIRMEKVNFHGKYSFQYIKNAVFENCYLDTKDAFWHGEHILVKNSVVKGEYLAWYSNHLTLENCKIIGTQPFCYCKNLKLIDCELLDADLCFEKSEVEAKILTPVISIKNPYAGKICVPQVGEVILDDENAKATISIAI